MPVIEIDNYLKKIDKLTDNGNLDQAAFHCLYLLRQFPKMLRVYERLGRAFLEKDNYSGALNTYLRLCAAQPDNFLNHISLAYTYVECGRNPAAVVHCETATCLQPDNQSIERDLTSWMTAHSVSFSTDDKVLGEFKKGIRAYQEGNYQDAIKHFLASEQKPVPNLPLLYLGLSYFKSGDISKGVWLLETIIRKEPYNQTALRTLCVHYAEQDQMKFKRCLNKLVELDPLYLHWEIRDDQIYGQHFPINIAYYDWTGIPNTRVRIGWHQASEKLITNDNTQIPAWLELLPIPDSSEDKENSITSLLNEFETYDGSEGFYRRSFFSSKNTILQQLTPLPVETEKKPAESGSELDEAFSYLEQIAEKGFQPAEGKPTPVGETEAEKPVEPPHEEEPEPEPTPEDRQMMREAWRCFSTDQQDLGVQLYKKLIGRKNCVSAVKEELEKLVILFPDNKELEDLFNSIH